MGAAVLRRRRTAVRSGPADTPAPLDQEVERYAALHRAARDLLAPLDLAEVLDALEGWLRAAWTPARFAVLVPEPTTDGWILLRQLGGALPRLLPADDLPGLLARAGDDDHVVVEGPDPATPTGLATGLRASGELVGLVLLERGDGTAFTAADVALLEGFAPLAGSALAHARAVADLRTAGADAERARIAGELHDRVGQSLATLGFDLDRLRRHAPDDALRPGIEQVRADLRSAMGEVRDTLHGLGADVSDHRSLGEVLEASAARVRRRTGAEVTVEVVAGEGCLPLLHERELWRIAREALANAEHHARATTIAVRWAGGAGAGVLEVVDDGCGFELAAASGAGRYGLAGMRQRAAGIGATLSIRSAPGEGTCVRCTLLP